VARSHKVDKIDIAIIRMLQVDGRRPYADIAAKLGLAPSTVQQRANRLMALNLLKVTAVTDPAVLNVPVIATIALKVDGVKLREAALEISKFESVNYVIICTGPFDIFLEVACENNDDLLDFISEKLAKIEGIRSSETFVYLRIVKNAYEWGMPS